MSDAGPQHQIEDALSALLEDDDFQLLESQFGRFNIFEAAGMHRRELDHSNFLGFLLSPNRPHGLGSEPLRRLLKAIVSEIDRDKRPTSILDLVVEDLDDAVVHRERFNIDILIEIENLKTVVAIENKVGAKAGEGQLDRYAKIIADHYPNWRPLLVFLTPSGVDPEDERYAPFSYSELAKAFDTLVDRASPEVALVLRHYLQLLRRHVVEDEKLKALALRIYDRHREAFEFVFEVRPEPGSLLHVADQLIDQTPPVEADRRINSIARFAPKVWTAPALKACPPDKWTKSGRNLLFEIKTFKRESYDHSDRVLLALILGPSDQKLREHFFSKARAMPKLFVGCGATLGKGWVTIFSRELLSNAAAKTMDEEQKEQAMRTSWEKFVATELTAITEAIAAFAADAPSFGIEYR